VKHDVVPSGDNLIGISKEMNLQKKVKEILKM